MQQSDAFITNSYRSLFYLFIFFSHFFFVRIFFPNFFLGLFFFFLHIYTFCFSIFMGWRRLDLIGTWDFVGQVFKY